MACNGSFAGFMPFIVMTGMHWAFLPTALMGLANVGFDIMLLPAMLASNIAQAGATFGAAAKAKTARHVRWQFQQVFLHYLQELQNQQCTELH